MLVVGRNEGKDTTKTLTTFDEGEKSGSSQSDQLLHGAPANKKGRVKVASACGEALCLVAAVSSCLGL